MAQKTLNTRIVLRNDSSTAWLAQEKQILLKGEVGIEFLDNGKVRMKVGDGTKTWKELPYFGGEDSHVFEVTATASESDLDKINEKVGQTELNVGDSAIVKRTFGNGKVSHTAYVWDGAWKAMDGNYSADNVYFDKDLQTTVAIGNIGLTNGQANIPAAGKNLNEVWQKIFVKEKEPSVTNPSLKWNDTPGVKYLEIGTEGTANVKVIFEDGNYEFGYIQDGKVTNDHTTGVKATKYHINYGGKETNASSATINSGVKTSKASMSATATVDYNDGYIPASNTGNEVVSKKIKAGSANAESKELFRWYIPMYAGFKYSNDVVASPAKVTNSEISTLGKITDATAYSGTVPTSGSASKAWRQYFVAVPASYKKNISGAKDSNNLTLTVAKANDITINYNGTSILYNVWFINNAADYKTPDITINW